MGGILKWTYGPVSHLRGNRYFRRTRGVGRLQSRGGREIDWEGKPG